MAQNKKIEDASQDGAASEEVVQDTVVADNGAPSICGIVMPISATVGHPAEHWKDLLRLLKIAIKKADFEPLEVWVGSHMDMITDRILSNLFKPPILVCDITDLNPNVMFELGLRLASKNPTIVIMEEGTVMPFDIKDFGALAYPKHLSYTAMEIFMADLGTLLQEKMEAKKRGNYKAFFDRITALEVMEPTERPVEPLEFVLSKLEDMANKLDRMSNGPTYIPLNSNIKLTPLQQKFFPNGIGLLEATERNKVHSKSSLSSYLFEADSSAIPILEKMIKNRHGFGFEGVTNGDDPSIFLGQFRIPRGLDTNFLEEIEQLKSRGISVHVERSP